MKTRVTAAVTLGAAAAVLLFAGIVLAIYDMRPTPGTAMLVLGWISILAAGYFLVRAVNSIGLVGAQLEELSGDRRNELEREKRLLLKAIKEVEFDRDTGKLDDREAEAAIQRYRGKAVEILRLLEAEPQRRYEEQIEAELARRLATAPAAGCVACGAANDDDAAFCKKCGLKLEARS
jgi:hypothetical protein